jgi:hypothetical protein
MIMLAVWVAFWTWITPLHDWFENGAGISAFAAACLWLRASRVKIPNDQISFAHPIFEKTILDIARRQSRWNAWAAGFSALAAFLTFLGVGTTTFFHW